MSTTPDFDSAKGYYWMKQTREAIAAGTRDKLPRRPVTSAAQMAFNGAVERRLGRQTFTMPGIRFSPDGKIIRDEPGAA